MSKLLTSPVVRNGARRKSVLGIAVAAALALPQVAAAMEFDLGSEALTLRWDNTLRVNIQDRIDSQDRDMMANPNYDDGDGNFGPGSIFTRFDLYSEADLVWKPSWGKLGARVSASGWWDPGYQSLDNDSLQTENHLEHGQPAFGLSPYAKRYAEGPSGEWMDWFVFAGFNIGEAPVNIKVGQTTVYYGEAMFSAAHAIAYGQNPVDVWKSLNTPGSELKELYRPRVGFNINSQVTDTLNVAAQYFFNWQDFSHQAWRYPESGTYLTLQDGFLFGGDSIISGRNALLGLPAGTKGQLCGLVGLAGGPTADCFSQNYTRLWRGKDITPDENSGNFGIALRWSPEWAAGTIGAYYRRTYDMQPQVMVVPDIIGPVPLALANYCRSAAMHGLFVQTSAGGGNCVQNAVDHYAPSPPYPAGTPILSQSGVQVVTDGRVGTYNLMFGSDIDIYGISLSRNVGPLSLGAELSYRTGMPLLSEPTTVIPAALRAAGVPLKLGAIWSDDLPKNDTAGAKGDTMHGLVNLVGILGESIWDTASWSTELSWMTWLDVTQNEAVFKGRGSAKPGKWTDYTWAVDHVDKNYFGLNFNFTPTWFQVRPGMDVLVPLNWSQGISGNSAVSGGGQDGSGQFGFGIGLDFYQRYRFDLKYVGFYGDYQRCKQVPGGNTAASLVGTCVGGSPNDVAIFNGTSATVSDRDFISLTFKTTF